MIVVTPDGSDVIIDLRGQAVSSLLTGTLRSNYKIVKTSIITATTNDRYTAIDGGFFSEVTAGDYSFEVINSSNEIIYRERVKVLGNAAQTYEANEIEFQHKIHNV